jgi:hypothetical protein
VLLAALRRTLEGDPAGAWLSLGPVVLAATCPPQQLGRALGRLAAATGVGGVVGPLLSAPLLPGAQLPVLAGAAVLALGAALLLPRTTTARWSATRQHMLTTADEQERRSAGQ